MGGTVQGPEQGALKLGHHQHSCGTFLSQASSDQCGCKEGDGASIKASGVVGCVRWIASDGPWCLGWEGKGGRQKIQPVPR